MTRSLPPRPNLDRLKNEAKSLHKMYKKDQPEVCSLLRHIHRFSAATDEEILAADVLLTDVQFALAIDYGFDCWQSLRDAVSEVRSSEEAPSDDAGIIELVDGWLFEAVKSGASDLHFEPFENSYRVRFRIDGVLREVAEPPVEQAARIAARIKTMAGLDIAERRLPQVGRIKVKIPEEKTIDFRASTLPVLFGEKITMRFLDPASSRVGIDALGLEPAQKALFLEALHKPQGVFLVTGPTGSGQTVTLFTGIVILNTPELEIYTVEDPVEINLDGVNQCPINPAAGLGYERALRSCMLHDPDVLLVGEIRDAATAGVVVSAAQTGHMVLAGMNTNSVPETLVRLRELGVASYNLARSVNLITAQRLIRRLCPDCKIPLDIPKAALIEAGFSEDELKTGLEVFGPGGCDKCRKGYKGRLGIHEVVKVTDPVARIIMEGGNAIQIAEVCQQEGFANLFQSALNQVKEGSTSLEEVHRVIGIH